MKQKLHTILVPVLNTALLIDRLSCHGWHFIGREEDFFRYTKIIKIEHPYFYTRFNANVSCEFEVVSTKGYTASVKLSMEDAKAEARRLNQLQENL